LKGFGIRTRGFGFFRDAEVVVGEVGEQRRLAEQSGLAGWHAAQLPLSSALEQLEPEPFLRAERVAAQDP